MTTNIVIVLAPVTDGLFRISEISLEYRKSQRQVQKWKAARQMVLVLSLELKRRCLF